MGTRAEVPVDAIKPPPADQPKEKPRFGTYPTTGPAEAYQPVAQPAWVATASAKIKARPTVRMIASLRSGRAYLTAEETEKLLTAADDEWRSMILMGVRTGLRIGELLALVWSDIDLKAGRVTVSKSLYQAKGVMLVQPTKTNQIRYVPLEPELLAALVDHRKKLVGPKNVFCHSDGRQFTRFEARKPLERAAVKAGLKNVRLARPASHVRFGLGHQVPERCAGTARPSSAAVIGDRASRAKEGLDLWPLKASRGTWTLEGFVSSWSLGCWRAERKWWSPLHQSDAYPALS